MNRWGDVVYSAKPYTNITPWSGQQITGIQIFGSDLSSGTYYYVVKLGPTIEPLKGFLELLK